MRRSADFAARLGASLVRLISFVTARLCTVRPGFVWRGSRSFGWLFQPQQRLIQFRDVVCVLRAFSHRRNPAIQVPQNLAVLATIAFALFWSMPRDIYRIMDSDKKKPPTGQGAKSQNADQEQPTSTKSDGSPPEFYGPKGPEPTRYGDWEQKGRCTDF